MNLHLLGISHIWWLTFQLFINYHILLCIIFQLFFLNFSNSWISVPYAHFSIQLFKCFLLSCKLGKSFRNHLSASHLKWHTLFIHKNIILSFHYSLPPVVLCFASFLLFPLCTQSNYISHLLILLGRLNDWVSEMFGEKIL